MIISLGGLGVFLSALLIFYNKGYRSANIYLGLVLFFLNFIVLTHYIYIFNQSAEIVSFVLSIPINATAYTIGPLAFLYVRSILRDAAGFKGYDWLHFIIFSIFFIGRLLNNLSGWDEDNRITNEILSHSSWKYLSNISFNLFLPLRIDYILKAIHISLYVVVIWGMLTQRNFNKSVLDNGINQSSVVKNWLYFFMTILTSTVVLFAIIGYLIFYIEDKISFQNQGNIIFSLIFIGLLVLILGLILFPQILYGIPIEKAVQKEIGQAVNVRLDSISEIFSNSEDYMKRIRLLLENWTKQNKFLDVDTSVNSLAKDINLPVHHINYFFNHINNEKYIDWRNRKRIEYAISLINVQPDIDKTIEALGMECGFKSYARFIQSFKQITGKLPSEYIREIKQKGISSNEE